jgi:protein-disulfide isomerase
MMPSLGHKVGVAMLLLVSTTGLSLGPGALPAVAQAQPGTTAESGALQDEMKGINTELERSKNELKLLRAFVVQRLAQPAPSTPVMATVSTADHPLLGRPDAPLTVVEFPVIGWWRSQP